MTEKRFKLSEPNGAYLIDGDKPLFHLDDSDDKIVELLNSLNDENEQLKQKEMDFLEKRYEEVSYLKIKIEGLEKDIKELKQENILLKGKLHRLRIEKGAIEEEIECLSEETIEKFKEDLQNGEFIELTARPNIKRHKNDHISWKGDVE